MKRSFLYLSVSFCGSVLCQNESDTLGNASLRTEDSTNLKIVRLNLNSMNSDFSPYVLNGQFMFVSGRYKNGAIQYVDNSNSAEITDIYTSTPTDSFRYKNVNTFDPAINSKYHEGPFCFNKSGTTLYYTKNDPTTGLLKIYSSEKINDKWTKPKMLPFCEGDHSYCHPALTPNGNKLVFASNKDPKNKMDLYVCEFKNGAWSTPRPLNSKINDSANQVFPFISSTNILYFASKRVNGLGGLDIYYTYFDNDTSVVRILPVPVNSSFDDFGVWIDPTSGSGYFSSNRNSRYKDDIYYFGNKIPEFNNWKKIESKNKFCYTFFEERLLAYADTLKTVFEWDFGDGQKGKGLKARHCYQAPGEYLVKLNTVDHISGEVFTNETSSTLVIEKPDRLVIDGKEIINEGQDLILRTDSCYLKGSVIDKLYWSFGDGKYNYGRIVKHRFDKAGNYKIMVGLTARDSATNKQVFYKIEKNITVMRGKN